MPFSENTDPKLYMRWQRSSYKGKISYEEYLKGLKNGTIIWKPKRRQKKTIITTIDKPEINKDDMKQPERIYIAKTNRSSNVSVSDDVSVSVSNKSLNYFTPEDIKLLKKIFVKATHQRSISQEESLKLLEKIIQVSK